MAKPRKPYARQTVGGLRWSEMKRLARKAGLLGIDPRTFGYSIPALRAALKLPLVQRLLYHQSEDSPFEEIENSIYAGTYEFRMTGLRFYDEAYVIRLDDEETYDEQWCHWGKSLPMLPTTYAQSHPSCSHERI